MFFALCSVFILLFFLPFVRTSIEVEPWGKQTSTPAVVLPLYAKCPFGCRAVLLGCSFAPAGSLHSPGPHSLLPYTNSLGSSDVWQSTALHWIVRTPRDNAFMECRTVEENNGGRWSREFISNTVFCGTLQLNKHLTLAVQWQPKCKKANSFLSPGIGFE